MSAPTENLATPKEVAEYLGRSVMTLAHWRSDGIGPRYYKLSNRAIRYDWNDVRSWVSDRVVSL